MLIYPSTLVFFWVAQFFFIYEHFFICQAEFGLMYMVICCPNFNLSVLNSHVLLCGFYCMYRWAIQFKVNVQFETKGNGQNEIVSNMDRSEVKISISEKNIVTSHIQNEILKQKYLTGSEFEGAPKLLKAFFSRLFLCQNCETFEVPTRAVFRPRIWNLVVLYLNNWSSKPCQRFLKF